MGKQQSMWEIQRKFLALTAAAVWGVNHVDEDICLSSFLCNTAFQTEINL